ncbi:hypothetical protein BRARA_K01196 [Brassica rapa]|uniref:RNase H type-1 domain-containing protein n=1 Tax=Brassica campestris TaxID=3711 RepID=A0A397L957_BRACM|nr:hypothetical protein BRARA_K01196 [Brassica rapa]
MGVAWVVRNHRGVVLMHSRRAFSNVRSLAEARLASILWAVESMSSLHYTKVVFAGDYKEIFMAVQNPLQWPALRYQVVELKTLLQGIADYQLLSVLKEENRGAAIIAQSVTREGRMQSYVATGKVCLFRSLECLCGLGFLSLLYLCTSFQFLMNFRS